jgi:hypothetical protein
MAPENENEETAPVRFTFGLDSKLDEDLRDTALILGMRPSELCERAVKKYIEAIEKSAGGEFQKAKDAIAAVRKLG